MSTQMHGERAWLGKRRCHMLLALVMGVAVTASPVSADAAQPAKDMLQGQWRCEGVFISSGKPLSSTVRFVSDEASGAVIVHHDDRAPGNYHAVEVWSAAGAHQGARAAIVDQVNGMRSFESPGWSGLTLVWSRNQDGKIAEQFTYRILPTGLLSIDWSVSRSGGPLTLGDTLTCAKERP